MSGTFIVIDGIDGSGKATQTELLRKRLVKEGRSVRKVDFPRYDTNFFGKLIGECLRGDYGDFIALHPKIASVLYAGDRWETAPQLRRWLQDGDIIISDRYVSANKIHQTAKFTKAAERAEFLTWLDKMEYEIFAVPKPDVVVLLDVPAKHTKEMLQKAQSKKTYTAGKKDLAEESRDHQGKAAAGIKDKLGLTENVIVVNCTRDGELCSPEEVHEKVYDHLRTAGVLK